MKFHRFFVADSLAEAKQITIRDKDLIHQIRNVLRMTVGGQVVLLDGSGREYTVFITHIDNKGISCDILKSVKSATHPKREITLAFALIKKNNMDLVIQKGTELGVSRFLPFVADRSEKKGFNRERSITIAKEAIEQSQRATVPIIREPVSFEEIFSECKGMDIFLFNPKGEEVSIEMREGESPACLIIGPEGGFTDQEVFMAKKWGAHIASLGSGVLRAETASIAASTIFLI
ncbi:MAG: RsmE family RNA methyltransferase [Minisyncoccia bacterium]